MFLFLFSYANATRKEEKFVLSGEYLQEYRKIESGDSYSIIFNQSIESQPNTIIIFPILKNCVVKVFEYEKRNGRIEVEKKDKNPIFAVNSLMKSCELEITTSDEGEFEFCSVQLDSTCRHIFLSTRANDYFKISDKETANSTFPKQDEDICFVHSSIKNANVSISLDSPPNKKDYLVFHNLNIGEDNDTVIYNISTLQKLYREAAIYQWHTGSNEKSNKMELNISSEKSHDPKGYSIKFEKNIEDKSVVLIKRDEQIDVVARTMTENVKKETEHEHVHVNKTTKKEEKKSPEQLINDEIHNQTNDPAESDGYIKPTGGFGSIILVLLFLSVIGYGIVYLFLKNNDDMNAGIPLENYNTGMTLDDAVNNLHTSGFDEFAPDPLKIKPDDDEDEDDCGFIAPASGPIPLSGFQ